MEKSPTSDPSSPLPGNDEHDHSEEEPPRDSNAGDDASEDVDVQRDSDRQLPSPQDRRNLRLNTTEVRSSALSVIYVSVS